MISQQQTSECECECNAYIFITILFCSLVFKNRERFQANELILEYINIKFKTFLKNLLNKKTISWILN